MDDLGDLLGQLQPDSHLAARGNDRQGGHSQGNRESKAEDQQPPALGLLRSGVEIANLAFSIRDLRAPVQLPKRVGFAAEYGRGQDASDHSDDRA